MGKKLGRIKRWNLWKRWVKGYGPVCFYCNKQIFFASVSSTSDLATIDHLIPLSKGGTSKIENLAFACALCNQLKADSYSWWCNFGKPRWPKPEAPEYVAPRQKKWPRWPD